MTNQKRIVSLSTDGPEDGQMSEPQPESAAIEWTIEDEGDGASHTQREWLAPAAAILVVAGWTAWFVWARQAELLRPATPAQWTGWIGAWAMPVVLVVAIWLLAMRSSSREATRFGNAARRLNDEARLLEHRLTTVNRELSLAREFLAAQSRDLESLGRVAGERISQHADRLQGLIRDNGAQVDAIGTVSAAALDNMERLRSKLPVLAGSAKDVTNNIGNAGRAAHGQLQDLISGFQRLNEFGQASERQALAVRGEVDSALGEFRLHAAELDALMTERFAALAAQSAEVRQELASQEASALAGWRDRVADVHAAVERLEAEIAQRRAAFDAEIARRAADADAAYRSSLDQLSSVFAQFDEDVAARTARQQREADALVQHAEALTQRVETLTHRMDEMAATGQEAEGRVSAGVDALTTRLGQTRQALAGTDEDIARLTDSSVRLLELIRAGVQHSSTDLPNALAVTDARLADVEDRILALVETTDVARVHGESLSAYVLASEDGLKSTAERLDEVHAAFAARSRDHADQLAQLIGALENLREGSEQLSAQAQGQLAQAIATLEAASRDSIDSMGDRSARQIEALAGQLAAASDKAIEQVLRERTEQAAGQLEQAAAGAAHVSREAMLQMRDQLSKVNELVGNLERRVAHARERAEEKVDSDFSRRVALINESLNSNAIDIARALSADVSDTAWSAYLKGDRGIFTRRAVSLMDAADARAIVQLYEDDRAFRDHVSRFIHDFEAMLRQLLSTRDGHALGVTLLSSDLGKLYVALAQSIERLRT